MFFRNNDTTRRDTAKKMSLARAFEVSKEFTEEELLRMAAESSTSAVVGVAKVRTEEKFRARRLGVGAVSIIGGCF